VSAHFFGIIRCFGSKKGWQKFPPSFLQSVNKPPNRQNQVLYGLGDALFWSISNRGDIFCKSKGKMLAAQGFCLTAQTEGLPYLCTPTPSVCLPLGLSLPLSVCQK